jgi:hypothetical protein
MKTLSSTTIIKVVCGIPASSVNSLIWSKKHHQNWVAYFLQVLSSQPKTVSNLTNVREGTLMGSTQYQLAFRLQGRHIFMTNDTSNNTFVTVTSSHFIPNFQLTLLAIYTLANFKIAGNSSPESKLLSS